MQWITSWQLERNPEDQKSKEQSSCSDCCSCCQDSERVSMRVIGMAMMNYSTSHTKLTKQQKVVVSYSLSSYSILFPHQEFFWKESVRNTCGFFLLQSVASSGYSQNETLRLHLVSFSFYFLSAMNPRLVLCSLCLYGNVLPGINTFFCFNYKKCLLFYANINCANIDISWLFDVRKTSLRSKHLTA